MYLPDCVNNSIDSDFTQIPNSLLRDPTLSSKAKTYLFILLSFPKGWSTSVKSLDNYVKEGRDAIYSGMKELVDYSIARRIYCKEEVSKKIVSSFWSITNIPGKFGEIDYNEYMRMIGREDVIFTIGRGGEESGRKPNTSDPNTPNQNLANPSVLIQKELIQKEKEEEEKSSRETIEMIKIKPSNFEQFWKIYPDRTMGKGSFGQTQKKWNSICSMPLSARPRWRDVKLSLHNQKKCTQWQDPLYIPLPRTWLNDARWKDDSEQLNNHSSPVEQETIISGGQYLRDNMDAHPDMISRWVDNVFLPATTLLDVSTMKEEFDLAEKITDLNVWFREKQTAGGRRSEQLALKDRQWNWESIPGAYHFVLKYIEFLFEEKKSWMGSVGDSVFNEDSKILYKYKQKLSAEIELDIFTGRSFN